MRLTNTIRDAFVRSAMDDVPSVDHTEEIRKIVLADVVAQLPPAVAKVYANKDLRNYLKNYFHSYGGVSCCIPHFEDSGFRNETLYKLSAEVQEKVSALADASKRDNETRESLRSKLAEAAYSCRTRKQLVELLPEFEKYLPADERSANVVNLPAVANILSDFVKAGWPKNQKKIAKAA